MSASEHNASEHNPASADCQTEDGNGPGRSGASAPPALALPCLISNSCTEEGKEKSEPLSPYRKKCRHRLIMAIEGMVKKHGIERIEFLTLTFGVPGNGRGSKETRELREQAKDLEFVQKRWHSFATHVVSKRYEEWVCVLQLHRDGVWHFHVVVATKIDIRTGTDIERLTDYRLPYWQRRGRQFRSDALAKEWQDLRTICCKYRFGRVELLPIKKKTALPWRVTWPDI
jgi:hypothetical protein